MKEQPEKSPIQIANCSDLPKVSICFRDPHIGELFAELLNARGAQTVIIEDLIEAPAEGKIITEPCFFPILAATHAKRCLIVGPKRGLSGIAARCLEQPLTEDGVEEAIDFLVTEASE